MKTRTRTHIAPPPAIPGLRGLVSGAFLAAIAALAALALLAAPPAEAQTARTITVTATGDNGDRDATAPGLQVNEGDVVTVSITIDGLTSGLLVASTAISGTAAIDGADFTTSNRAGSGNYQYPSSTLRPTILSVNDDITIVNDSDPEGDETIILTTTVSISPPGVTVTVANPTVTITILANDGHSLASLGGTDATLSEGATVNVPVNFQDTMARTADAMVAFSVTGTATSADYSVTTGSGVTFDSAAATGSITVAAAASAGAIPITITADSNDDEGETLIVTLTAYTGGGSGILQAVDSAARTYTLVDSVRTLTVTCDPAAVAEGASTTCTIGLGAGDTAFTSPTAVTWTVTHGDTVAADFGAVTGSVMFPTASTFAITPADDNLDESAESFTVQISVADATADGGTAFGAAASLSVTDNDTAGLVIAPSPLSVPEKGMANYTVRLETQPVDAAADVMVAVTVRTGGGTVVEDLPATTLTFDANNWNVAQTVTVTAAEDAMIDDSATLMHEVTVNPNSGEYMGLTDVQLTVNIVARPTTQATHDLLLPEVTRAVVGQQMQAIAGRVGTINGGGVGDSASFRERGFPGFAGAAAAHLQSLAGDGDAGGDGDLDAKELLRGLEFVLPLSAGASHGGYGGVGDIAFWGGSDYRDFSGEDGDDDWDGSVLGLHFGVDGRVRAHLHAGLMVSYNDAESEYTRISDGTTDKGDYELNMTSVSPFLNWKLNGGNAWASVTYGSGEVEVKPDGDEASRNDVNMTGVAAGGSRRLLEQGGRELSLRADAFIAESEVEGDNDNATAGIDDDLDVDANRLRVALAWNYPQRFSDGRLTPAFDLGLRHDGGDGRTGTGLELGGALKFFAPAVGLTLEGNARALLGHTGDHRAWGIGGLMRVESGADGQGLAVTVAPSYGGDFGGGYGGDGSVVGDDSRGLWNGNSALAADVAAPVARLNAEVSYGMPAAGFIRAFGFADSAGAFGDGMLTPYSALRVGDASRDYRLGLRWNTGQRIALDLSARHINAATNDNAVTLEGRLRF